MNTLTIAEIKRSGFAALELALTRGPVHLMKRNRAGAVVLRTADYEDLLQRASSPVSPLRPSGLALFLSDTPGASGPDAVTHEATGLDAAAMDVRLAGLREGWSER
jgi:hypothetical protein